MEGLSVCGRDGGFMRLAQAGIITGIAVTDDAGPICSRIRGSVGIR